MTEQALAATPPRSIIGEMATRFGMERAAFEHTLMKTIMPANTGKEDVATFLIVAREHDLNPFLREIYAFPKRGGGVQPIVPIDGWIKIINRHPNFNGMHTEEKFDEKGVLVSVTCTMYRKDRDYPYTVTEYLGECKRDTEQWRQMPARMLRHKAVIQCARYTFGFAGIVDPDEAERMIEMGEAQVIHPENAGLQDKLGELREKMREKMRENLAATDPAEVIEEKPA